jgi:Protein of unknown function (DUF3102)
VSSTSPTPTTSQSLLTEHANAIRALGKRVVADIIEIGRRLTECKRIAGHGNWLPFLDSEFGWRSEDTAQRFMQVYTFAGQIPQIAEYDIPVSGLYLLAAPSTPDVVRQEVIARAEAGEKLSVADVRAAVEPTKKPSRKATSKPSSTAKKPEPKSKPADDVAGGAGQDEPPDEAAQTAETPATVPERVDARATHILAAVARLIELTGGLSPARMLEAWPQFPATPQEIEGLAGWLGDLARLYRQRKTPPPAGDPGPLPDFPKRTQGGGAHG